MYVINGKFLGQKKTGVQRFAYEIINQLDNLSNYHEFTLLVPKSVNSIPELKNIKIIKYGSLKGILWEQLCFPFYLITRHATGLNLGNVAPLIKPDIVCMHDMNFKANPDFFSWEFVLWYNIQMLNFKYRAKKILTVSQFSKNEIIKYYKIKSERIHVIYNGWEHIKSIESDDNILNNNDFIRIDDYYFTLSSLAPNKNIQWILKNAKYNPNEQYLIAGGLDLNVYGKETKFQVPDNVHFLGYISDSEVVSLISHCKAFLFPTLYEGFGIPPLEALALGSNIIVSNTECMREIYSNVAYFIDPYEPNVLLSELLQSKEINKSQIRNVLYKYSWIESGLRLKNILYI